jgi:replicative DNA helicase
VEDLSGAFERAAPASQSGPSGRRPPSSLEAERAVIGGILLENDALNVVLEIVRKEDFYSEANAQIFEGMTELFGEGTPVDTVTIRERLVARGKLAAVGGDDYILELTNTIPTVANIESHARIVKEKALVRRLITACHEVAAKGYGDYGDPSQFLDSAEKQIFDVAQESLRSPYEHIKEVVLRTFTQIHEAAERGEKITGLPTGFSTVDEMTSGMHPGDLIIIAGRPGMGKTAFAINVAVNACMQRKEGVAVFSLEMPKEQLVRRMLCSEARVDGTRMRAGQLWRDDWPKLARAAGTLSELPLWIDDTPGLSMTELRAKTRRIKSQNELGLVVVDYLQLMRSGSRNDSREQEISEISRNLKMLAKELSLPVIALSQLNRGVETRGAKDKRPQLSDLRESGAIEQDADTIWFVYRDEVYNRDNPDSKNRAEIIIGKQRAGPTGVAHVAFFSEYTRFDNLAREDYGGGEFGD